MTSLRIACRTLLKTPSFAVIALLTLALGIGVNSSMYTLVDVLLLRNVPFTDAERLASVLGTTPQSQRDGFSYAEFEELHAQSVGTDKAFESLVAYSQWNNTLAEPGKPAERLVALDASVDFFTTFRIQPTIGRAYNADEEIPGRSQVAVLSHQLWQSRFNADPNIVGRSIRLNAEQVTIIGVMPASFVAPLFFGRVDVWRPITIPRHIVEDRGNRFFTVVARRNAGVSFEQAKSQLLPVAARWMQDYPQNGKERSFNLLPPHKAANDSTSVFIIWFMFGIGAVVLLIACANIANLQLARATANARDLAIRSALGASRARLILHQLTESLVLSIAGGLLGVCVAKTVNTIFGHAIRLGDSGNFLELPMDGRILGATFVFSLLTGVIFGVLPAWFASRNDVVSTLKQQTRGSTAGRGPRLMRHALIVGEVALALALLSAAGVMIRGLDALLRKDKGWDTDHVLAANIHLPEQSTYNTEDKRRVVTEKLIQRLAQIPGAEHTGICSTAPLFGYSKTIPIQVDGQTSDDPAKQPSAGYTMVASDYFATLGIPLMEGRLFPHDLRGDSPPVVVIGQTMAQKFWPNESAIGKRIGDRQDDKVVWREVIGVVRDIEFALNITNPDTNLQVYKPYVHEPWGFMFLVVRGATPASFKNDVRRAVADIDPDVAVQDMYTIPEAVDRFQHNLFVVSNTIGGFALLGLVLASVGLYGVISNLVAQRTSEFGIRLALGARPRDVLALVMGTGVRLTLVGLVVGAGLGWFLIGALKSSMPRMISADPVALGGIAVVLFLVSLFASWWPARRATQVDPLTALRAE